METGRVPDDWRTTTFTAAYTNGQKYIQANYRPTSITCICCKIIEHIVTSHIMKHAEAVNILYPLQHGFRSKRFCETGKTNSWLDAFLTNRAQVVAVEGEQSDKGNVES
ncbi:Hypothetical predicted protein [Mytilus galloprovincialis]|uniref:Reverse transcriptase domain-containing protein n=1 Tax=Mytilus galloprovincialis TaxID=29158 RepID=A0A8B6EUV0_MYTGA|nr:Hypothetical predicted protein [Mytilus galloprovincialis]